MTGFVCVLHLEVLLQNRKTNLDDWSYRKIFVFVSKDSNY
ncbi:hypothetical protein LEP1GSC170_5932 [Leptospira interrogans serovar Bataviae str. HAI135]|uniref:Uncharacterized protein n=2 Tax=Leptospira noguchii TaxID=28182 RepID=T0FMZ8_9LEPT|nr:hypothetical protein LEP1GSC170_5932 [Leptospira interrogans serovar Bataviae str. HAI135]EMO40900.1 hypothetical protein LEP1GSC186_3163 [Leptospira noguchii serovar Autumnalis str. ZUN142]EQA71554.1 hypothetical protein LEP1GSC059_2947 [Leptospira noguchii serovar Panama str. CZ214]